jgi:hypothetical protein
VTLRKPRPRTVSWKTYVALKTAASVRLRDLKREAADEMARVVASYERLNAHHDAEATQNMERLVRWLSDPYAGDMRFWPRFYQAMGNAMGAYMLAGGPVEIREFNKKTGRWETTNQ